MRQMIAGRQAMRSGGGHGGFMRDYHVAEQDWRLIRRILSAHRLQGPKRSFLNRERKDVGWAFLSPVITV